MPSVATRNRLNRGKNTLSRRKALWARITKNPDCSTGPLARPFAHLLAPLTHLLALPCSLCSHAPLHSLIHLLAHFAHSLAHGKVIDQMTIHSVFFLFSTIAEGQFLKLSYVIQQMHQQTVSPCLSVCPSVFHSVHLSLSVSLSGWLAGCLSPMGKGYEKSFICGRFFSFSLICGLPSFLEPIFSDSSGIFRWIQLVSLNFFPENDLQRCKYEQKNRGKSHHQALAIQAFSQQYQCQCNTVKYCTITIQYNTMQYA